MNEKVDEIGRGTRCLVTSHDDSQHRTTSLVTRVSGYLSSCENEALGQCE